MGGKPEEIWQDDLLDRREDATLLIGFIESIFDRKTIAHRDHAYTIAVDAPYGVGKSFFLRRLSEELSNSHPVAFVDAWTDDLANEPLIALISTLKRALGSLIDDPQTNTNWNNFVSKSGKVAGIVTLGLLRRGAGLLITAPAVGAVEGVLTATDDAVQSAVTDGIPKVADGLVGDFVKALKDGPKALASRIEEFETGQASISDMKQSLLTLISNLPGSELAAPVVIIVDELDRCRPSYAIKLFEEIKHLFDVPGLVFIFGVHATQLAHSVKWAYGADFDGSAYLKRFINRQYTLKTPSIKKLVDFMITNSEISADNFLIISYWKSRNARGQYDLAAVITLYVELLNVSPRELFELFDILEMSVSIVRPHKIILHYILPLIVARIRNIDSDQMDWKVSDRKFVLSSGGIEISEFDLFRRYREIRKHDAMQIRSAIDADEENFVYSTAGQSIFDATQNNRLSDFRKYDELISTVRRFSKGEEV